LLAVTAKYRYGLEKENEDRAAVAAADKRIIVSQ
jgi:hypothetical protein